MVLVAFGICYSTYSSKSQYISCTSTLVLPVFNILSMSSFIIHGSQMHTVCDEVIAIPIVLVDVQMAALSQ